MIFEDTMRRPIIKALILSTILGFFLSVPIRALETDRQQQVLWSSDGGSIMRINGNTRILEMSENVKVTQGSLKIIGSEAIFEYLVSTNELTKVTVRGSPVQYQQQLDEDGNLVTGTSDTLVFYSDELDETILELVGNANIESPDSTMSCAAIIYIADQDLIREATGPCQGMLSPQSN